MEKHTILFLAANPSGTDKLALDREARAIQLELERSGYRDHFEFATRWAVQPLDLLHELRKLKPTVVHFSGHGGKNVGGEQRLLPRRDVVGGELGLDGGKQRCGLFFQGTDGRLRVVSTEALTETFGAAGASVKLVVLNACYTEIQAEALLAHVDCVVGMGGSIQDDAARSFAIGFYGGLGEREAVATAYMQGKAAITLEGLLDGDRPQLKVRDGVDASRLILVADRQASATVARAAAVSKGTMKLSRRQFIAGTVVATATIALVETARSTSLHQLSSAWDELRKPDRNPVPNLDEIFGKCTNLDLVPGNDHPRVPHGILHPDILEAQKLWADRLLSGECNWIELDRLPKPRPEASQILLGGPITNPRSRELHGIERGTNGFRSVRTTKLRWAPDYPPIVGMPSPVFRRYISGDLKDAYAKYIIDRNATEEYRVCATKKNVDNLLIQEDFLLVTRIPNDRNPAESIVDILELHSQGHKAFACALDSDEFRSQFWNAISAGRRVPARAFQLLYRVPVKHDHDKRLTIPLLPELHDVAIFA